MSSETSPVDILGAVGSIAEVVLAGVGVVIAIQLASVDQQVTAEQYVREHVAGWSVVYENYHCTSGAPDAACTLHDGTMCRLEGKTQCEGATYYGKARLWDRLEEYRAAGIPANLVPAQYKNDAWMIVSPALGVEGRQEACRQAALMLMGHGRNHGERYKLMYDRPRPRGAIKPEIDAMERVLKVDRRWVMGKADAPDAPCIETNIFFWYKPAIGLHRDHFETLVTQSW